MAMVRIGASNMSTVIFQGEISQVQTRSDRTIKVTLESALEMTSVDELAALFSLKQNQVTVAIKEGQFTDKDVEAIPEPMSVETETKPLSQRIRGALYVLHKKKGGTEETWDLFYKTQQLKWLTKIKEEIEKYN